MDDKYCLYMHTIQANAIKILFEVLKDVLNDVIIVFDETGARVTAVDGSHVAMIHMRLYAEKCEEYYCEGRINAGINMSAFNKLIKTVNNNDTVTFFMDRNETNELGISISNSDKNLITTFKLKLLDLDVNDINIPDVVMECIITMPSNDFQRLCRDMMNISETLTLNITEDNLYISCNGDFARQETIIGQATHGLVVNRHNTPVKGNFSLKYLNLFTRGSNLCNTIELYMKNNFPLILKYNIANLGEIQYVLAPKNDEQV